MSTTALLALLLGLVLAPVMIVKAFATPFAQKSATFGLLGAGLILGAAALAALAYRAGRHR